MRLWKKVGIGILAGLVAIQFIRPARNVSGQILRSDLTHVVAVPQNVQTLLAGACYDCHSNDTRYPWYMNVQPAAWFMAYHVKNGKAGINFSEFGSYSKRKQANKLKSVAKQVETGEMPLSSYTMMHPPAKLSKEQKDIIINWAKASADSLSSQQ